MKKHAEFVGRALKLGALDAKVITASAVATSPWVRLKCQYGCGMFGVRLTCPPNSPGPDEARRLLSGYQRALLVRAATCRDVRGIVAALEREMFLGGFYKAFAMGSGPCALCAECGETCRHPEIARPAMEACGIDVFLTVKSAGFPLEVLKTRSGKQNCYGLVLIE
jgi:predicted metal-binding protein